MATDPPTALSTQLPYKDTWRGALGAKRRLGGAWLLSAGVGYDSPMVEDEDRSVTLPAGMEWLFAAGAQRQMSERFGLGFGYTLEWLGNLPVDEERGPLAGHVAGSYDNTMIHLLSLQGHWRF